MIVGNTAVPLLWRVLDHPGNSDTAERICLLLEFLTRFGRSSVRLITADREFIGKDWLAWLSEQKLPFCLRIRCSDLLRHRDGRDGMVAPACTFFERTCPCRKVSFLLWNQPVFAGGKRLADGDWRIVVSNRKVSNRKQDLLAAYGHRWGIETLFQSLKGRGLDLEGTGTDTRRLGALLGLLSLCCLWCLRAGLFLWGTAALVPLKCAGATQARSAGAELVSPRPGLPAPPVGTAFGQAMSRQLRPGATAAQASAITRPAKLCL